MVLRNRYMNYVKTSNLRGAGFKVMILTIAMSERIYFVQLLIQKYNVTLFTSNLMIL